MNTPASGILSTRGAVSRVMAVALSCQGLWKIYEMGDEKVQAVRGIDLEITKGEMVAIMGPSGCGKSTLLRCLNRLNDLIEGVKIEGEITISGTNIYDPSVDLTNLRRNVGMVFQKSNPFPLSIYENIAYGLKIAGIKDKGKLDHVVEKSLKGAALWDEVKDRLNESAYGLSGGQQQRLCIARAIAVEPTILLMDEPCSALDPIATAKVEELIKELKKDYTIVIHGKSNHEETRATFSHAAKEGPSLIVKNIEETKLLEKYIRGEKSKTDFYSDFEGKYSEGFDPEIHLR